MVQGHWEALGSTGRHWEGAGRQQGSGEPQDRGVQAAGSPSLDTSEDGGANPAGKGCQWGGSGRCRVAARAGLTWWPSRRPCGRGPLPAGARRSPAPPSRGGPQSTGPQRRWWSLRGVKRGLRGAPCWWLRAGEPGPPPSDRQTPWADRWTSLPCTLPFPMGRQTPLIPPPGRQTDTPALSRGQTDKQPGRLPQVGRDPSPIARAGRQTPPNRQTDRQQCSLAAPWTYLQTATAR